MAGLIDQKQIKQQYDTFRSGELPYVDGTEVIFTHGWDNFDPSTDWFQVQAWARCIQAQAGWIVGEIALLNGRRCTIDVNTTQIKVRAGANGINIGRKNGNLNEVNLNDARWLIFVNGVRRRN